MFRCRMDVSQIWDEHNCPWRVACCTLEWRLTAHLGSDDTMTSSSQQPDLMLSAEVRAESWSVNPDQPPHYIAQNAHNTPPVRCHSFFSRDSVTWFWLPAVWVVYSPRQRFCLLPFLGIWYRLSAGHLWYCAHLMGTICYSGGVRPKPQIRVDACVASAVQPSWGNIFTAI